MPQRKNPTPQKITQEATLNEDNSSINALCQNLQLGEVTENVEALRQMPIESLYKENEVDNTTVSGSDKNDDGKFVCIKCNKEYTTASGLRYHIQNSCTKYNRDKYTCLVCLTNFTRLDEISNHISTVHLLTEAPKESRRPRRTLNSSVIKSEIDDGGDDQNWGEEEFVPTEDEESQYLDEDLLEEEVGKKKMSTPRKYVKKPRSSTITSSSSMTSFAALGRPFVEVMGWLYDFLEKLEKEYPTAYPNFVSNLADWTPDFDFKKSDFTRCPRFEIRNEEKGRIPIKNDGIDAFCASVPTAGSTDLVFNAGGPVWALSWCPISLNDHGSRQYLAVSAHAGLHSPELCYSELGLIQIWDCGVLYIHRHESEIPKLAFGISLNEAPVWDIKWCRIGGKISSENNDVVAKSRIGLIAAACASGKVLILAIPDPASADNAPNGGIYKAEPEMVLLPTHAGKNVIENVFGQCLCVDWTLSDGGQWLAGGYSKGLVALWKLKDPSDLLSSKKSGTTELISCRTFQTHIKAVQSLCWCPFDEKILATGGADRFLKLWNRNYTEAPNMVSTTKTSIPMELTWPSLWCGFFASTDEVFAGPWCHGILYFDILCQMSTPYTVISFKSACWSVSHSDWMNCVVGADATGLTVIHACSNWNRKARGPKVPPKVRLFGTDVRWDSEGKKTGENEGFELIFCDTNFKNLARIEQRDSFKKVRLQESYPGTVCDKPFVQSVNRISWNPNFGSHTWIASGMQCGLIRLHCVDAMHSASMDKTFENLSEKIRLGL